MQRNLRIAVCQMTSIDDVEENYLQIEKLLKSISVPFDLAVFPENCLYMRLTEGEKISGLALEDPVFDRLKKLASDKRASLHLGSVPLRENGKLTNASVLVTPDGGVQCTYRKMHLFDITLEGQKPIRESDIFNHGTSPAILNMGPWKIGQAICYDLRFAELFSAYAKGEVDAILIPSAFLVRTGQAHWDVLLRARAIESQCYVLAAAQAGVHINSKGDKRMTYGHSLVVNPWGEVTAKGSSEGPEAIVVELEKGQIESVRRQIPMRGHRRL